MTFLMLGFFTLGCSQKTPEVSKTQFSKEALRQTLENEDGKKITVQEILNQHKGKILVIDFFFFLCRDCLIALPKFEELERNNPYIDFVLF